MRRPRLINLANGLTLSRFIAAPLMLWLLASMNNTVNNSDSEYNWYAISAPILLGIVLLTDLLDGMVARRMGQVTDFGKIMDPVADSTFFMTLFFGLTSAVSFFAVPIWMPLAVLYREVAMQVLRRYAALEGKVMAASWAGKAKTAITGLGIAVLLLLTAYNPHNQAFLKELAWWIMLGIVIVNWASFLEYGRQIPEIVREWRERA